MNEFEQAFQDLCTAIRLTAWSDRPCLYDINGTAEVIAEAVVALVEKRRNKDTMKVG